MTSLLSVRVLLEALSGNVDHVWNAVILDLLGTARAAMKLRQCIVTNRCLFWQTSHIVTVSPLPVGENVYFRNAVSSFIKAVLI